MTDLTNSYQSLAINKKTGKTLIKRNHSTKQEAQQDIELMEQSQFFDAEKFETKIKEI